MIIFTAGDKGGTGKSTVAHVVANYLINNRKEGSPVPLFIDLDTANPDLITPYLNEQDKVLCQTDAVDVSDDEARKRFLKAMMEVSSENPERDVLVNFGARSARDTTLLKRMIKHLRPLVLWVIDRNAASIEALQNFLELIGEANICAVENGHFGSKLAFEFFERNAPAIPTAYFPKALPTVTDYLYRHRIPIHHWDPDSPYDDRMKLDEWWESADWVDESAKVVAKAMGSAKVVSSIGG